jgi:hypothetical protein
VFFPLWIRQNNLNWIHTRTFVEENKTTEVIQYANGLQQGKQTQTYLPSSNSLVVGQEVYDFSARPSLSPLPLPEPNRSLSGYQSAILKDANGNLYTEDNFDIDSKINNPDPMTGPVSNYDDGTQMNRDNSNYPIPSSESAATPGLPNYPYARSTFYGDGTDRHKESSGVGKPLMIGQTAGGKVRTTRTSYSNPSDERVDSRIR